MTEGEEATVFLQPLARIDDPAERSWAAGWIGAILAREARMTLETSTEA